MPNFGPIKSLGPFRRHGVSCMFGVLLLWLAGCQSESPGPQAGLVPPPPEVEVVPASQRLLVDYREYTGRTTAVDAVEIRARVSGYLLQSLESESIGRNGLQASDSESPPASPAADSPGDEPSEEEPTEEEPASGRRVRAKEGTTVEQGTLLFEIDPRPYELALQQSQGSLAAAQARLKQANQDLSRSEELLRRNATSRSEYDQAIATVAELRGQIENLKATVARNELDLDFTRVRSPIDGLLGRSLVTNGNLVVADSTVLTTVVSTNPIYVEFVVDEQSVLEYRRRVRLGEVQSARVDQIPIRLGLANEEGFPHEGSIDFVDNVTDPDTGNTLVRGVFDNDAGFLSPGLFARLQVPFSAEYDAVLIPTVAIARDQQGRYALVVDDDLTAQRRSIALGELVGEMTVIRSGIEPGDRVIVSGLQKVRPGMPVTIAETPANNETPADSETPADTETPADSETPADTEASTNTGAGSTNDDSAAESQP